MLYTLHQIWICSMLKWDIFIFEKRARENTGAQKRKLLPFYFSAPARDHVLSGEE